MYLIYCTDVCKKKKKKNEKEERLYARVACSKRITLLFILYMYMGIIHCILPSSGTPARKFLKDIILFISIILYVEKLTTTE